MVKFASTRYDAGNIQAYWVRRHATTQIYRIEESAASGGKISKDLVEDEQMWF